MKNPFRNLIFRESKDGQSFEPTGLKKYFRKATEPLMTDLIPMSFVVANPVIEQTYQFQHRLPDELLRFDNTIDPELAISKVSGLIEFSLPVYQASPINFQDIRISPLTRALVRLHPSEPTSDIRASTGRAALDAYNYSGLIYYDDNLTPNFSVNLAPWIYNKVVQHLEDKKDPIMQIEIAIECWTVCDHAIGSGLHPVFIPHKNPTAKFQLSAITFRNRT